MYYDVFIGIHPISETIFNSFSILIKLEGWRFSVKYSYWLF